MITFALPLLGALPLWLILIGAVATFLIVRFVLRLALRLSANAALIFLYIWLGHSGLF